MPSRSTNSARRPGDPSDSSSVPRTANARSDKGSRAGLGTTDALLDDPTAFARLDPVIDRVLAPWRERPAPVALLFSGGVDSSLLAWELRSLPELVLVTVGLPGAPDLGTARDSARQLGIPVGPTELTAGEIDQARARWSDRLGELPRARSSAILSLALAVAHAPPGPVVCGQGADELFLGYAHFEGLDAPSARVRSERDLAVLRDSDAPAAVGIARELGRTLAAPYLDPDFVAAVRDLPIELRMPSPTRKAFFRRWAVHRGLPRGIAELPKRAVQFGSRIDRALRDRGAGAPKAHAP